MRANSITYQYFITNFSKLFFNAFSVFSSELLLSGRGLGLLFDWRNHSPRWSDYIKNNKQTNISIRLPEQKLLIWHDTVVVSINYCCFFTQCIYSHILLNWRFMTLESSLHTPKKLPHTWLLKQKRWSLYIMFNIYIKKSMMQFYSINQILLKFRCVFVFYVLSLTVTISVVCHEILE